MHEAGGDLGKSVAVGIGFDDRDVANLAGQGGPDAAQVSFEGGEVYLGPATQGKVGGDTHAGVVGSGA